MPSIFCILKFSLIQVYLRSGTLVGLLLWLCSFQFHLFNKKVKINATLGSRFVLGDVEWALLPEFYDIKILAGVHLGFLLWLGICLHDRPA